MARYCVQKLQLSPYARSILVARCLIALPHAAGSACELPLDTAVKDAF
jgi:hypothetical protein